MYSSKSFEKIESASITLHIVCVNYLNTKLNIIFIVDYQNDIFRRYISETWKVDS